MSDDERIVAEIPAGLKERADADPRTIRQVVESALEREFVTTDTAAIERRIDEKRQRIQTLEREINDRQRELSEERDELERLEQQLQNYTETRQAKLEEAKETLAETPQDQDNPAVQRWADELNMTPAELLEEL